MATRRKNKYWVMLLPFLGLFALAVLAAVVIRASKSYKENNISFMQMVWYEIKFLFSFGAFVPDFEVPK